MHDFKKLRQNEVHTRYWLKKRGWTEEQIDNWFFIEKNYVDTLTAITELNTRRKKGENVKDDLKELKENFFMTHGEDNRLMLPNMLSESVPSGLNEESNVTIHRRRIENMEPTGLPHHNINELGISEATAISTSAMVCLMDDMALLRRAMGNYFLDEARTKGFVEIAPPYLVNEGSMIGTGQYPKFKDDAYQTTDGLSLIPTGEVPLTNLFAHITYPNGKFSGTRKVCGLTPCYRKEAGASGKRDKGLIRNHQFDKVELVMIVDDFMIYPHINQILDLVEKILKDLNLDYRKIMLCGGDTGFSAMLTFDYEVFLYGSDRWLEVSSPYRS